jgi:hypothetical protein
MENQPNLKNVPWIHVQLIVHWNGLNGVSVHHVVSQLNLPELGKSKKKPSLEEAVTA